ncbi:MAG: SDR family oxidoreductase [Actinomycetales bacterium]|nr:SDR family oxidoreductase [Actinomycetales bacterium]
MKEFEGHIVIVTGAASGIGAATSKMFLERGASVALWDISDAGLSVLTKALAATYGESRVAGFVVNVAHEDSVNQALAQVISRWGHVNHLVNSAANFVAAGLKATFEQWQDVLTVNVIGPAMLTAKVSTHMPRESTIVNISSISAHAAQPDRWTYNACKAAILALTRGQALDLRDHAIRVNSVSPGWIWTPEVARAAGDERERWERVWGKYHILERLGEADEVAEAVLFLSSKKASFITGTEVFVDGGYSAIGPEGLGETAKFAGATEPAN